MGSEGECASELAEVNKFFTSLERFRLLPKTFPHHSGVPKKSYIFVVKVYGTDGLVEYVQQWDSTSLSMHLANPIDGNTQSTTLLTWIGQLLHRGLFVPQVYRIKDKADAIAVCQSLLKMAIDDGSLRVPVDIRRRKLELEQEAERKEAEERYMAREMSISQQAAKPDFDSGIGMSEDESSPSKNDSRLHRRVASFSQQVHNVRADIASQASSSRAMPSSPPSPDHRTMWIQLQAGTDVVMETPPHLRNQDAGQVQYPDSTGDEDDEEAETSEEEDLDESPLPPQCRKLLYVRAASQNELQDSDDQSEEEDERLHNVSEPNIEAGEIDDDEDDDAHEQITAAQQEKDDVYDIDSAHSSDDENASVPIPLKLKGKGKARSRRSHRSSSIASFISTTSGSSESRASFNGDISPASKASEETTEIASDQEMPDSRTSG